MRDTFTDCASYGCQSTVVQFTDVGCMVGSPKLGVVVVINVSHHFIDSAGRGPHYFDLHNSGRYPREDSPVPGL
jgi:hypothetical protein